MKPRVSARNDVHFHDIFVIRNIYIIVAHIRADSRILEIDTPDGDSSVGQDFRRPYSYAEVQASREL